MPWWAVAAAAPHGLADGAAGAAEVSFSDAAVRFADGPDDVDDFGLGLEEAAPAAAADPIAQLQAALGDENYANQAEADAIPRTYADGGNQYTHSRDAIRDDLREQEAHRGHPLPLVGRCGIGACRHLNKFTAPPGAAAGRAG